MNDRCKSLVLLLGLALAVALAGCTQAADPLESLIARHVEARGGMERLEAIRTLRASGRASAGPGREALVTREVRPPGRIRTEFAFQGVTAVYACDGSKCWSVDPRSDSFEPELMSEFDTSVAIAQADLLGPLVNWEAKGHSVELLGKEQVDGRETFKLKVTLSSGAVHTDYLDAESALLVRRDTTETLSGQAIEVETTYSDFRPVGGVVFPHFIRSSAKDRSDFLEVVVKEAELNPPLDDSRFEMPE
ncbi:MAG: hypothetical protein WBH75_13855 [Thermoanaerobaculia bacterium]